MTDVDELFDTAFVELLRRAFLRARKRRALQRQGAQEVPLSGGSREFRDRRPYVPGDDFRSIDWRCYARLDRLFIRQVEDQQEYHVHLLIDTSASLQEPYGGKRILQLRAVAALAYLALIHHHRVSLYRMQDGVERLLPPRKGQGHLRELLQVLAGLPYGGAGDPARALRHFQPGRGGRGLVVVASDLLGPDPEAVVQALPRLALQPAQVHVLQVLDPAERDPEAGRGSLLLQDVETGTTRRIELGKREIATYRRRFDAWQEAILGACRGRGMDYQHLDTGRSFEEQLIELLERNQAMAGSG